MFDSEHALRVDFVRVGVPDAPLNVGHKHLFVIEAATDCGDLVGWCQQFQNVDLI